MHHLSLLITNRDSIQGEALYKRLPNPAREAKLPEIPSASLPPMITASHFPSVTTLAIFPLATCVINFAPDFTCCASITTRPSAS